MIVIVTGINGYVEKQPVAWKEYCAQYWLNELQERMYRYTGHHYIIQMKDYGVKYDTTNHSSLMFESFKDSKNLLSQISKSKELVFFLKV